MIIKEIYIDGFGVFRDYSLKNLDRGVHIIRGRNEAGKSTLLKFIRYTLFGYPRFHADRMPPLIGGDHGGRIVALLNSGEEAIFDRKGNDRVRVTYRGSPSDSQSLWDQLLGHAHRELFNNIYSFTLDELTGIGSLDESGMQDKIFSLGMGLGKTSIGEISGSLAEYADKIYKPRGRKHRVADLLDEIDRIREKNSKIRSGLPEYERLEREIAEMEKRLAGIRKQTEAWKREKTSLDVSLKCYDSFLSVSGVDRELDTLPELADYPENGPEELRRIEQEREGYLSRITDLREGAGGESGMQELEKKIGRISFNGNLLRETESVEYLGRMLEAYRLNLQENEKDERRVWEMDQSIGSAISGISGTWSRKQVLEFTELAVRRDRIREYRDRFGSAAERKRTLEAKADALMTGRNMVNMKVMAVLISVFLLSGSALFFYYSLFVPGAVTLVLAALTFFSRNQLIGRESVNVLDQQIGELEHEEAELRKSYHRYLTEALHLPPDLTPGAVLEILDQIGSLKKEITEQQRLRDRIERERTPEIQAFEARVESLSDRVTDPGEEENTEVLARRIIEEYAQSKALREKRDRMEEELTRKRREAARLESKVEALDKKERELFASTGAGDWKLFLEQYRQNDRVRELQEQRRGAVRNIESIAGQGMAEEVLEYLERHEKSFIEEQRDELSSRITSAEEEENSLWTRMGEAGNELRGIEGRSELADSLTELETQKHLLQKAYEEWMVHRSALVLLEQVKGKYEKEKQPELIRSSGAFLERITSGRYTGIHVSMDDREILVSDRRGAVKRIDQLSRGTREQLLISLRLGLIREYERRSEPLPVVIDEVLVNFDPERAKAVTSILEEFAGERQVLVFTCHPSTAGQFGTNASETVLETERGSQNDT